MTLSPGTRLGPYEIATSTPAHLDRITGAEEPEGRVR